MKRLWGLVDSTLKGADSLEKQPFSPTTVWNVDKTSERALLDHDAMEARYWDSRRQIQKEA